MHPEVERQGYRVVRDVLSESEIASARASVKHHLGQARFHSHLGAHELNASVRVPELSWLFAHPGVIGAVRESLGGSQVFFTLHSDLAINRLSNWHKDSNGYFSGDYFDDPEVQVLKVGLYLQDMVGRAALQVQPGSHRTSDLTHDRPALLETRAGDLVIFDVRLNHTGQLADRVESGMKWATHRLGYDKFHPRGLTWAKDAYWRMRRRPDRLAVFFTYGADNPRSAEFAAKTQMRQRTQLAEVGAIGEPACPGPELERALLAAGAACWSEADRPQDLRADHPTPDA